MDAQVEQTVVDAELGALPVGGPREPLPHPAAGEQRADHEPTGVRQGGPEAEEGTRLDR